LSLDFAEQGVNTLWGSFEIKNTRLLHKLLQQFSREPLPVGKPEMMDSLNALADRFQTLPLYFMKFHGGSDVDDVLDAMDFAAYVHDVEHIILDNMQFMISRSNTTSGGSKFDKFDVQDIAIEKFRKFATDRNVHITLVVHPRKEDEGAKLGISSIYGSAKATQEADLVLILQNDGHRKYIEVKKNRFDGTLGFAPLHFQRSSGRYLESPDLDPSQQTRARTSVPTLAQAGTRTIQARIPKAAATTSSDIDNHWDSMLEDDDDE
jgi:twinkle protein